MPNEVPPIPPPPNAFKPAGAPTPQQKRWIKVGIVGGAVMLLAFSVHGTKTAPQPTVRKLPTVQRTEPATLQGPPDAPPAAPETKGSAPPPAYQNPPDYPRGGSSSEERQPSALDRIKEDRLKREEKAAYEDSLIPHAALHEANTVEPSSSAGTSSTPNAAQPSSSEPLYTLPEGTILNCSLVNKLNGDFTGPVFAQVSIDVYDMDTDPPTLLIPQGARVIGEASHVGGVGQERLSVSFHRIMFGHHSVSIDKMIGMDQEGATALKDRVNNHIPQVFGAALALGALGAVAQIGNGYSGFGYDPSVEMRNGITQSMAQSSERILDRILQKNPRITIRSGTRLEIALPTDIKLPAYEAAQ